MHRAALLLTLSTLLHATGCLPAAAGGLVVAGGASLYAAKQAHGDCGEDRGSAHAIACTWVDMLYTIPLMALGISLTGTGVGLGIYAAVRD